MTTASDLPHPPSAAAPDVDLRAPTRRGPSGGSSMLKCESGHERVLWAKAWSRSCWICESEGEFGYVGWSNTAHAPEYREAV